MQLQRQPPNMSGLVEDAVGKAVTSAMDVVLGKPGTEGEKSRVEFFSSVLSRTGEKFVASPTGKETVNKALFTIAVPAFLFGVLAGYLYLRRKQ